MSEQYSNHRDTPLRRFNTFWWGLAYFGIFGLVSAIVYWMSDDPTSAEDMRKVDRLELREKVDNAQNRMLAEKDILSAAEKVITPVKASDSFVPGTAAAEAAAAALAAKTGGGPGFELYNKKTCNTCHGADGNTPLAPNYPKLAGQNAEYLLEQMKHFKDGSRSNGQAAVMKATMAAVELKDDETKLIIEWLAKQEPAKVELAEGKGKELYTAKLCATCHGPNGDQPIMPLYPKISGQSKQYLIDQMKAIKDGSRSNGQAAAMKAIMANVSDEETAIIAEWLSGEKK